MQERYTKVATSQEIRPGTMKRVAVAGRRILIANVEGRFYAADDTCTHEEASLSMGLLKGELIACPLHGSRFSVRTGEVMEEPAEEALRTYALRIEGDDILVDLR